MGYEIERKFLIRRPSEIELFYIKSRTAVTEFAIEQTYLTSEEGTERRVRKRSNHVGSVQYFYTEKRKVTELKRVENEKEISEREYLELLKEADSSMKPLKKTRYVIPYRLCKFEMDVYPWDHARAILEVEIPYEDCKIDFPTFIDFIREVTDDPMFKNNNLARSHSFPD